MEWWSETRWYAIQAKPHREETAAAHLRMDGVEVFLPRIQHDVCRRGVRRQLVKPLFPGYLFARFCPDASLGPVQFAHGVLRVVSTGKIPVPLGDEIIAEIQARAGDAGFVRMEPRRFQPGDAVTVQEGPFMGLMGRVEREWDDGRRVMILLEALHQARVLIEKRLLIEAA